MSRFAALCLLILAVAGCEVTIDPETGDAVGRFTFNDENAAQQRMRNCTQFASQSYCQKELWGG